MVKTKYTFHYDLSHAWIEVDRAELKRLGILNQISAYSYQSKTGLTVYLEEDCDAYVFIKAYQAEYGNSPEFVESNRGGGYNFIRSLPQFRHN